MERIKQVDLPLNYGWFLDKDNEDIIYALSPEAVAEKKEILEDFDRKEENVPDGYTVKALKIGLHESKGENDIYRIMDEEAIDFPVNKMGGILLPMLKV